MNQGRKIEGEFIASWQHVQEFYERASVGRPFGLQVLGLISQLRQAGYEKTLRAGTSLFSLLVSRSRRHGLKHTLPGEQFDPAKHDPYIAFTFGGLPFNPRLAKDQVEVTAYLDDGEHTTHTTIDLDDKVNAFLKRLQQMPIR